MAVSIPAILSPERALNRWVEHATAVRDDGNWPNPNTVGIAFNKFVSDRNFRRELADRVGRPFDDTGINEVYAAGGGSSFEGTSKHGHAQEMKINERWILARENIEYRSLFQGRTGHPRAFRGRVWTDTWYARVGRLPLSFPPLA